MNREDAGGLFIALAVTVMIISLLFAVDREQSDCPDGKCPVEQPDPRRPRGGPLTQQPVGDLAEGIAPNLLDLPPRLRTRNYAGGSCAHAAIIDLLKWHGMFSKANWWRSSHRGAYGVWDAVQDMERAGLRYAYTTRGDERLLEWASRNGHGAMIHYYYGHAVTFRGYADGYAYLCDNNRTGQLIEIPKDEFIRRWKGYGGRAITLVYSPTPPIPIVVKAD